ncbi:MAG: methyltransferase domain-containing protein [Spirochaetes bacterium]|nr:methyltransferase domain-containing protein [Spirochaetota bacterium]
MNQTVNEVKSIYSGFVAKHYDRSMSHFFARLKKKAFSASSLKKGDRVLVFCCGTGLDFPHLLKKIGNEGSIVGVDFSEFMLKQAQKKIEKKKWTNIQLINADVTNFNDASMGKFDAGVCTLGMSIIPDFYKAS